MCNGEKEFNEDVLVNFDKSAYMELEDVNDAYMLLAKQEQLSIWIGQNKCGGFLLSYYIKSHDDGEFASIYLDSDKNVLKVKTAIKELNAENKSLYTFLISLVGKRIDFDHKADNKND